VASHEPDLRAEIQDDTNTLALQQDYRQVDLDLSTRALLDFAVKLTKMPQDMERHDVDSLRQVGFTDEDIVDAAQLIGYFNYSNRVMDSLGIEPEPTMNYSFVKSA
jgi:uncharacterized peroxidase-related enzyme